MRKKNRCQKQRRVKRVNRKRVVIFGPSSYNKYEGISNWKGLLIIIGDSSIPFLSNQLHESILIGDHNFLDILLETTPSMKRYDKGYQFMRDHREDWLFGKFTPQSPPKRAIKETSHRFQRLTGKGDKYSEEGWMGIEEILMSSISSLDPLVIATSSSCLLKSDWSKYILIMESYVEEQFVKNMKIWLTIYVLMEDERGCNWLGCRAVVEAFD